MASYYYQTEVSHKGLNKYRVVKAQSQNELQQKVAALKAQWNAQWERKVLQEEKRLERAKKTQTAEMGMQSAAHDTKCAEDIQAALDAILADSINAKEFDFSMMKRTDHFTEPEPQKPSLKFIPREPQRDDPVYNPKASFFTKLSKAKKQQYDSNNDSAFAEDHNKWLNTKNEIDEKNAETLARYNDAKQQWEKDKEDFYLRQEQDNASVDELNKKFCAGDADAVSNYYEKSIDSIQYPIEFDTDADVEYLPDTKMLICDIYLPVQDDIPNLKSVTYVKAKNEFKEAYYSETYLKKKYESVIYQIVLRILKCVFSINDSYNNVNSCVINGKISTIDKATGQSIEPYILSINVSEDHFHGLNLSAIDPRAWFKSSKGVSAASIANVTPIAPIIKMSREDARFIEGYSVTDSLDSSINLAAMDWQDFENLIRELFEEEFRVSGGEVKITQASRDGGVDAVAFDPDPIRGGKIVIQAKRYTNVVGVSAVRDLYGTILNEGATKGILVSTSNYGNDAYSFAKDKPITLLNGAELLYLLEKHGHKARIDIKEAKEQLKNQ